MATIHALAIRQSDREVVRWIVRARGAEVDHFTVFLRQCFWETFKQRSFLVVITPRAAALPSRRFQLYECLRDVAFSPGDEIRATAGSAGATSTDDSTSLQQPRRAPTPPSASLLHAAPCSTLACHYSVYHGRPRSPAPHFGHICRWHLSCRSVSAIFRCAGATAAPYTAPIGLYCTTWACHVTSRLSADTGHEHPLTSPVFLHRATFSIHTRMFGIALSCPLENRAAMATTAFCDTLPTPCRVWPGPDLPRGHVHPPTWSGDIPRLLPPRHISIYVHLHSFLSLR
jgi:hypothetical protein